MTKIVSVSPAVVLAAKLKIKLANGGYVSPAVVAIANARAETADEPLDKLKALDLPEFLRSLAAIQTKELHYRSMNKLAKDIDNIFKGATK